MVIVEYHKVPMTIADFGGCMWSSLTIIRYQWQMLIFDDVYGHC